MQGLAACRGCAIPFNQQSGKGRKRIWCAKCRNSGAYPYARAERVCAQCGKSWMATRRFQNRYCSYECSGKAGRTVEDRSCPQCGGSFRPKHKNAVYCGAACFAEFIQQRAADRRKRIRGQRNGNRHLKRTQRYGGKFTWVDPLEIFERDQWSCWICGYPVGRAVKYPSPLSASLDHVKPLALGGDHTVANLRCAHLICNVRRGCPGKKKCEAVNPSLTA